MKLTTTLALILSLTAAGDWPRKPVPGWAVSGRVVSAYDGDTLTFEIRKRVRVRLIDCWSPEVTGPSKAAGLASRDNLRSMAVGKEALLFIPGHVDIKRAITFSRFVGHVWVEGDEKCLSQRQVESGFAKEKK